VLFFSITSIISNLKNALPAEISSKGLYLESNMQDLNIEEIELIGGGPQIGNVRGPH